MKSSRFTGTQTVSILKEADAGAKVKDICRRFRMLNVLDEGIRKALGIAMNIPVAAGTDSRSFQCLPREGLATLQCKGIESDGVWERTGFGEY